MLFGRTERACFQQFNSSKLPQSAAPEIEFVERTPHGRLRHASFRKLLPRSGDKKIISR
jgi:hypothetical protein